MWAKHLAKHLQVEKVQTLSLTWMFGRWMYMEVREGRREGRREGAREGVGEMARSI